MANEKVTLLRSAKIPGRGWRRAQAVIGKTGKVKPDFMFLGRGKKRKEVDAPEGHYLLRHCDGRLLRYKKLGNDPSEALDELQKAKNPAFDIDAGFNVAFGEASVLGAACCEDWTLFVEVRGTVQPVASRADLTRERPPAIPTATSVRFGSAFFAHLSLLCGAKCFGRKPQR